MVTLSCYHGGNFSRAMKKDYFSFSPLLFPITFPTISKIMLAFVCLGKVICLYCTLGKELEPHQNVYPEPGSHNNDAVPQHCFSHYFKKRAPERKKSNTE
jgi:hypothetical protein